MTAAATELHNLALHLAGGDVDEARGLLAEAEAALACRDMPDKEQDEVQLDA